MIVYCRCLLGFTALFVASASLSAQTHFVAPMDGDQQSVPVATTASGSANLVLDTVSGSLAYEITLVGLDLDGNQTPGDISDNVVGLHFHRAAVGQNGPVVFGLISPDHDLDDLTIDPVAGTLTGVWEETDAGASSPLSAELADLLAGGIYINVHTEGAPGGEIRGQVVQRTLADGLQLHIEFEDDVSDSSPNGFDGQSSGDLQFAPGVIGQAADFDGNDAVMFPNFPDDLIAANDFSITFWFDLPEGSTLSVFSKRSVCGASQFWDIRASSNRNLQFEANNSLPTSSGVGSGATTAGWHQVVFTRSGTTLRAFLDGEFVDDDDTSDTIDFTNTAILGLNISPCIGSDGTQNLIGGIDDLRIYDRQLTDSEVGNLGGIFADGFESGDVSAWSSSVP